MRASPFQALGTVKYGLWYRSGVSPMPRMGRKFTAFLSVSLVVALAFLTAIGAPVQAQEGEGEGGADGDVVPRTYTIRAQDTGCPEGNDPCWDIVALPVMPGDTVEVTVDLTPSAQPHNFHVFDPINDMTDTETGTVQTMTFEVPENANSAIEYICDVHPTTMVGEFLPPNAWAEFTAGGAHDEAIPELGVNFLAYWVGVIAFALLFIVYGLTFFLFKYNETSATTDQWDRSGTDEGSTVRLKGMANLLAVVIAVAAVAAIIFIATR